MKKYDHKEFVKDFAQKRYGTNRGILFFPRKKDSDVFDIKTDSQLSSLIDVEILGKPRENKSYILEQKHIEFSVWDRFVDWFKYKKSLPRLPKIDKKKFKQIIRVGSRHVEVYDMLAYHNAVNQRSSGLIKEETFLNRNSRGISWTATITALVIGAVTLYNGFKYSIDNYLQTKPTAVSYHVVEKTPSLEERIEETIPTPENKQFRPSTLEEVIVKENKIVEQKPVIQVKKEGIYNIDFSKTKYKKGRIVGQESQKIINYSKYNGTRYQGENDELKLYKNKKMYEIRDGTGIADSYLVVCYAKNGNFKQILKGKFKDGKAIVHIPKGVSVARTMLLNNGYSIASSWK